MLPLFGSKPAHPIAVPHLVGDSLRIRVESRTREVAADIFQITLQQLPRVVIKARVDGLRKIDRYDATLAIQDVVDG